MKKFAAIIGLFAILIISTGAIVNNGGSGGTGGGCKPTAVAPTYVEAVSNYLSCTLAGYLRVSVEAFNILLSGENQTYNLLETSGGVVRPTVVASAITTDTTSTAVALPIGSKTLYGSVDGTGAVTQTQKIYGGLTSGVTATTGELLCTFTLSATTHGHASCNVTTPWLYYIVVSSSTSGTSATGVVTAMY